MQRRRALRILGSLAGAPALLAMDAGNRDLLAIGARVHEALARHRAPPRALSAPALRAVEVAAEHIIPRTDTAGATDARVADFVDVMLADWYAPTERDRFLAGLAELDRRAAREHGRSFADAPPASRVALLTAFDDEVTQLRRTDAAAANAHWFGMLKYLTVWGYCTSRAGITEELRLQLMPGYYDGAAAVPGRGAR